MENNPISAFLTEIKIQIFIFSPFLTILIFVPA